MTYICTPYAYIIIWNASKHLTHIISKHKNFYNCIVVKVRSCYILKILILFSQTVLKRMNQTETTKDGTSNPQKIRIYSCLIPYIKVVKRASRNQFRREMLLVVYCMTRI